MQNGSHLSMGEKIMQIRKSKGLSQENIAHGLGVSRTMILRLERGEIECDGEILAKIRKYLKIENAPLTHSEIELYKSRMWVCNDILNGDRLAEAVALLDELSHVKDLPFEADLNLLHSMTFTRLLFKQQNVTEAEANLAKAEPVVENTSNEAKFLYHRNMGHLSYIKSQPLNGLRHYNQCPMFANNNLPLESGLLMNIGAAYLGLNKPYHAINFLERARQIYQGDRSSPINAMIGLNLSSCYLLVGEYTSTEQNLSAALTQAQNINNKHFQMMGLINYASLHQQKKDYEQCIVFCDRVLSQEEVIPFAHIMALGMKTISLFKQKKLAQSQETLQQASILITETKRQVASAEGHPLAVGLDLLSVYFNCVGHLMTLNKSDSVDYIQNVGIPYFIDAENNMISSGIPGSFKAIELCDELEAHFIKKRAITKANTIAAISRNIMRNVFMRELEL